jgi:hypothetical protein
MEKGAERKATISFYKVVFFSHLWICCYFVLKPLLAGLRGEERRRLDDS